MLERHAQAWIVAAFLMVTPFLAGSAQAALIQTSARPIAPALGFSPITNSYLLVWAEDRGSGTGLDLYAARMNANGIVVGLEVPLLVAPGNQSDPTLTYSPQLGEFMVFYTDDSGGQSGTSPTPGAPPPPAPNPTSPPGQPTAPPPNPPSPPPPPLQLSLGDDLGAVIVDPIESGSPLQQPTLPIPGQPTATPGGPTATPGGPTATPGGPGQPPEAPGQRDIYGMFVTASGQRVTNIFAVVDSPADETYPDLAYMPRGGRGDRIAFVWRQVDGLDVSINSMELTPVGRFFQLSSRHNVVQGGDLGRPSVAAEVPSGNYLVVWSQTPTNDTARDLFGRRLNSNAFPYGAPRELAQSKAPIDDVYPSVGSLGAAGGFVLAWERRDGANPPDIQVRQLNRNGVPYRSEYALAGGTTFSFSPDVSASDRASTLVAWVDRNAASDHSIIVAEVNRSGRRIGPERVAVVGGTGPGGVTPIPPPPSLNTPSPAPPPLPTP